MKVIFAILTLLVPAATFSASRPLFSKGAETFKIETAKGETPVFRVLSDSMTKQALAMATISLINAQEDVKPKIPVTPYLDLKFQSLTLTPEGRQNRPQSLPQNLKMSMKLSGYVVDLEQSINKKDLLAGKEIEVKYPKTQKDIAMYSVQSEGALKLHLDRSTQNLVLENVEAKMNFESPMGDEGRESVKFSGLAKRVF